MYGVALLASTLLSIAAARVYDRCELARDLLKLGVRREHIATWVCIAYHESRLDTAARNPSSGDHGLLQISEIYWCGAGKVCGLPCSALRDDDISDDVHCAQTIYEEHTRLQGNGFLAWVVYPTYCKHNPKKYLTDCDFTAKDGSHRAEERGRSSDVYDPYLTVNRTLSNSVQSDSYPQSGRPLPGYLAIAALLRGKFETDFEKDYNNRYKVNWSQSRPGYVDDRKLDFLSIFTTKGPKTKTKTTATTTTTTTTAEPEPYYPPVKPWRVIETNQFRCRKMKSDKAPSGTDLEIKNFVNTSGKITPTPTANSITNEKTTSALEPTSSTFTGTFGNAVKTLNSITERPSTSPSPFFTKQETNAFVSLSTPSYLSNPPKTDTTIKSEKTNSQPIWNSYNRFWTTPRPEIRRITSTQKPLETFNTNKSTIKPFEHEPKSTSLAPISTTSIRPPKSTDKDDNEKTKSSQSKAATFGIFRSTPAAVESTTMKTTTVPTRSPTRAWTVRQPQFQQFYSQNRSSGYQFVTENPQTTWRRGKSQPNVFQEGPFGSNKYYTTTSTTPRSLPSSTSQTFYRSNISNTSKPPPTKTAVAFTTHSAPAITTSTSTPNPKPVVSTISKQGTTEKPTTLSIFDMYLNPTKKSQLPNYSSLFSNKSPSNFKIFSGGTTASPVIGRT